MRLGRAVLVISGVLSLAGCRSTDSQAPPAASQPAPSSPPPARYLKGQLHLHSAASGDSDTPPLQVVRWYEEAGYDFIVFTDHNRITQARSSGDMLVFPGIELTQNPERCDPAPEPGLQCLLHVNGLFTDPRKTAVLGDMQQPPSFGRRALYGHALDVTRALGGIAVLNHPNFHYAADAALLTALSEQGLGLFEVANEAVDSNNAGDESHASTEALWDEALTAGARLYGVATDDAHHYEDALRVRAAGGIAHVGDRGWVMVRASRDEASIRGALERGDFYASNGVVLDDVSVDGGTFRVRVGEAKDPVEIVFIGEGGQELARAPGPDASFELASAPTRYVRAVVTDGAGRKAWVQPVWPQGTR